MAGPCACHGDPVSSQARVMPGNYVGDSARAAIPRHGPATRRTPPVFPGHGEVLPPPPVGRERASPGDFLRRAAAPCGTGRRRRRPAIPPAMSPPTGPVPAEPVALTGAVLPASSCVDRARMGRLGAAIERRGCYPFSRRRLPAGRLEFGASPYKPRNCNANPMRTKCGRKWPSLDCRGGARGIRPNRRKIDLLEHLRK